MTHMPWTTKYILFPCIIFQYAFLITGWALHNELLDIISILWFALVVAVIAFRITNPDSELNN